MADVTVLIVDADEFLRQSICTELESQSGVELVGVVSDAASGQRMAFQNHPDVVLIEFADNAGGRVEEALQLAEWLRVEQPEAVVLGTASSDQPDLLRLAMRAGIQDLLPRPVDPGQLRKALDHVVQQKARRRRAREQQGRVITLLGVGGGIGTTTIATNVAVAMAGVDDQGPVVLADFDLQMGHVPTFLDLPASCTYADLLANGGELDASGLRQLMPRHDSGLYVLAGPQGLEDLDAVSPDTVGRCIDICRASFKHVVVDAGHGLDERRIEILDRADRILVVAQLTVASLHSARSVMDALGRLGYAKDKVDLVVSRTNCRALVNLEDFRQTLDRKSVFSIPNDYRCVVAAMDSGVPLIRARRSGPVGASLQRLALTLIGQQEANGGRAARRRRGPMGWLLPNKRGNLIPAETQS